MAAACSLLFLLPRRCAAVAIRRHAICDRPPPPSILPFRPAKLRPAMAGAYLPLFSPWPWSADAATMDVGSSNRCPGGCDRRRILLQPMTGNWNQRRGELQPARRAGGTLLEPANTFCWNRRRFFASTSKATCWNQLPILLEPDRALTGDFIFCWNQ